MRKIIAFVIIFLVSWQMEARAGFLLYDTVTKGIDAAKEIRSFAIDAFVFRQELRRNPLFKQVSSAIDVVVDEYDKLGVEQPEKKKTLLKKVVGLNSKENRKAMYEVIALLKRLRTDDAIKYHFKKINEWRDLNQNALNEVIEIDTKMLTKKMPLEDGLTALAKIGDENPGFSSSLTAIYKEMMGSEGGFSLWIQDVKMWFNDNIGVLEEVANVLKDIESDPFVVMLTKNVTKLQGFEENFTISSLMGRVQSFLPTLKKNVENPSLEGINIEDLQEQLKNLNLGDKGIMGFGPVD